LNELSSFESIPPTFQDEFRSNTWIQNRIDLDSHASRKMLCLRRKDADIPHKMPCEKKKKKRLPFHIDFAVFPYSRGEGLGGIEGITHLCIQRKCLCCRTIRERAQGRKGNFEGEVI